MKFTLRKDKFSDALSKMVKIGTRSVKSEFDMAGRVTIDASANKVVFYSSNGFLQGRYQLTEHDDPNLKGSTPGKVTVNVNVLRDVVSAIGGPRRKDATLGVEFDGKMLHIEEVGAKGKKSKAKLETQDSHHEIAFSEKPKGFRYNFNTADFVNAITVVGRYQSTMSYRLRYQMICLHFMPEHVRFICGDGMRFAILTQVHEGNDGAVTDEAGLKHIIPTDQANIIASVLSPDESISTAVVYESETACYILPQSGLSIYLNGIPAEPYIAYDKHAYRFDKAQDLLEVPTENLVEGMALVAAVEDREIAREGAFHSARFSAGEGSPFRLLVDENRYQCDFSCDAEFKKLSDKAYFESQYAARFLNDVAQAAYSLNKSMVRFYCIDEKETIIATPTNGDDKDLVFFFAAALDGK